MDDSELKNNLALVLNVLNQTCQPNAKIVLSSCDDEEYDHAMYDPAEVTSMHSPLREIYDSDTVPSLDFVCLGGYDLESYTGYLVKEHIKSVRIHSNQAYITFARVRREGCSTYVDRFEPTVVLTFFEKKPYNLNGTSEQS